MLTNEQSALAVRQNRFLATVALIEALGGGWDTGLLPSSVALEHINPLIPSFKERIHPLRHEIRLIRGF